MEEKFILIACFLCSISGLTLIYFSSKALSPEKVSIPEINFEMVGRVVTTEGKIVNVRFHEAGHMFLTLQDGKTRIQIPIFSNLREKLENFGLSREDFREGRRIEVTGLVEEYDGQLQIVPRKLSDIRVK